MGRFDLRELGGELSGHGWTVGSWLRHALRPRLAPVSSPWSTVLEDPKLGAIRLTGQLRSTASSSVVLLVHGLAGDMDQFYVVSAARAAEDAGFSCLRLNLRGADRKGEDFYHAGLTADLHAAVASPELARFQKIFVLGFSLGGHVSLRYALDAPDARVRAIAAVSPPLDLDETSRWFDRPRCEPYRRSVFIALNDIYANVARRRPVPIPVLDAQRIRSIREWDDRIVAPRFGFRDAAHYYRAVSVAPWLAELRLPSLLIFAKNDPLISARSTKVALEGAGRQAKIVWLERGGHMGFPAKVDLGLGEALGIERQIISWFEKA